MFWGKADLYLDGVGIAAQAFKVSGWGESSKRLRSDYGVLMKNLLAAILLLWVMASRYPRVRILDGKGSLGLCRTTATSVIQELFGTVEKSHSTAQLFVELEAIPVILH